MSTPDLTSLEQPSTEDEIQWVDCFEPTRPPDPVDRLEELVWRGERRWPDKDALQHGEKTWTYSELADTVRGLASGMLEWGIQPEDRVVVLADSSPYWLMVYFGIVSLGATAVPLEPERSEDGVRRALRLSKPSAGFIKPDRAQEDIWTEMIDGPVFKLDDRGSLLEQWPTDSPDHEFPRSDLTTDQFASILFTSGTTGESKGVCLSHRNFASDLDGLYQFGEFSSDDRFLSILPMFHSYEFTGGQMLPLYAGATIVYARDLVSSTLMDHFKNDRITVLLGVPLVYKKLQNRLQKSMESQPAWKRWFLDKGLEMAEGDGWLGGLVRNRVMAPMLKRKGFPDMRLFVCGGAPLNPEIPRLFQSLGLKFLQGYGMTELSPVVTVNGPDSPFPGAVGKALPETRVGVLNPNEQGVGEIVVSGPMVFERYLGRDEATPPDPFPTGDMGRIEDGYLFVEGRKKFTIVTAEGKNVYPERVEDVYGQSPMIGEILVVGKPRPDGSGAQLKAIVVPDEEEMEDRFGDQLPDENETARIIGDELKEYGKELQPYERIRDFELRFEPFPRTPTQKIKRYLFDHHIYSVDEKNE